MKYLTCLGVIIGLSAPLARSQNSDALEAQSYYPLEIGNMWQYRVWPFTIYQTVEVVGNTLMANGNSYRVFKSDPYTSVIPKYQRFDSIKVWVVTYAPNRGLPGDEETLFPLWPMNSGPVEIPYGTYVECRKSPDKKILGDLIPIQTCRANHSGWVPESLSHADVYPFLSTNPGENQPEYLRSLGQAD